MEEGGGKTSTTREREPARMPGMQKAGPWAGLQGGQQRISGGSAACRPRARSPSIEGGRGRHRERAAAGPPTSTTPANMAAKPATPTSGWRITTPTTRRASPMTSPRDPSTMRGRVRASSTDSDGRRRSRRRCGRGCAPSRRGGAAPAPKVASCAPSAVRRAGGAGEPIVRLARLARLGRWLGVRG